MITECLFCKIINKEIPAQIVFEDEDTIGILDIKPRSLAHTMILPKVHAENILDLSADQLVKVFNTVKTITQKLKEVFQPDGFTIGINHGRASGQMVDHLHIHIIPRWRSDGGGSIHSVVNNPPALSLEEVKNKIIQHH